jgi:hypothetical protein
MCNHLFPSVTLSVAVFTIWQGSTCLSDGTFSPWPLSLVDRADSVLLNVGE